MCVRSGVMSWRHTSGEVRSAARDSIVHFVDSSDGLLGAEMSVRMIWLMEESERSALASAWPMKPPAPVMRILAMLLVVQMCVADVFVPYPIRIVRTEAVCQT